MRFSFSGWKWDVVQYNHAYCGDWDWSSDGVSIYGPGSRRLASRLARDRCTRNVSRTRRRMYASDRADPRTALFRLQTFIGFDSIIPRSPFE